jgi:phosphoribosyl-ATP pyrophosphohydrolase/phosphoribosyl-AMP cyclohydrolase
MKIDFEKYADGLVPAIVQDSATSKVLMLGFMNAEAFEITRSSKKATFFSRSRGKLWTKGETSGNFLAVEEILLDCDDDTILIKGKPAGAVCHTGADTCFGEKNFPGKTPGGKANKDFLFELEEVIKNRRDNPSEDSYTARLLAKGINKIAQKVGEEAVELVIEAKDDDDELFKNEAADLLYHFLVLLAAKNIEFNEVLANLKARKR